MDEIRLQGIGVSEGIRIGSVFRVHMDDNNSDVDISVLLSDDDIAKELIRLEEAKERCEQQLKQMADHMKLIVGEQQAGILSGQVSFLNDSMFYLEIAKKVKQGIPAVHAIREVAEWLAATFESMPNEYMKERALDLRDIGRRLQRHITGHEETDLSQIKGGVIVVADELTPSEIIQLNPNHVLGLVTKSGGRTSHTSILSYSLGISTVVGIGEAIESIKHGDQMILDGSTGEIFLHPSEATRTVLEKKVRQEQEQKKICLQFAGKPALTSDGIHVDIGVNIGTVKEAELAKQVGADGIGLFRTEFLFMNAVTLPDEDTQYRAYRDVLLTMRGKPVIIRTLDIGGDKNVSFLKLPEEDNPFLGYRAIRICLENKGLFRTQLRAILRASVHGKTKIMFPMIGNLHEWREAKGFYEQIRLELQNEGVKISRDVEVGMMVEIPSAALLADRFAKEADFFSIGTNDLVQYTLAVDRMNSKVASLYDHFHPSVLHLIDMVAKAARTNGKRVGMCGGMAGDPLAAPILLAAGIDEWGMEASKVNITKSILLQLNIEDCRTLYERALSLSDAAEVRELLEANR